MVLLAVAFGVLEEETATQSFFNPNHVDLHQLSRYGLHLGVQWLWALTVTFYHATVSVLVPLAIVDGLYPEVRDQPLLSRRGLIVTAAGLASSLALLQLCPRQLTARHRAAAVIGSLSLLIAFEPIQELGGTDTPDPNSGMAIAGLKALQACDEPVD